MVKIIMNLKKKMKKKKIPKTKRKRIEKIKIVLIIK
jgi:hypothetical protein